MDNQLLNKFRSEISYFLSSNKVELLAVILTLIVLPNHSEITIYTDSNNIITEYYNIIDQNNFDISPRKFFKISSNNIFWNILCEIIVIKSLIIIDFVKVKGHSDNYYNNYIDKYISYTNETSEINLQKFLKKITLLQNWKKFFNLNCNGKYRKPDVNVD
ncbi:hypothetical protein C1646_771618 [Rhizophagus diaphanus]|nr:hypothetical protein C1646_771618 [Rhizophagus diaphanus] [Rhizophagus sp. MUCL 43196]